MASSNNRTVVMQRYKLGRLLGQGTFAKVYYARNLQTGAGVAIKIIDKARAVKAGLMEQIEREISIMRRVRHPNVVELYEVMATKTKIYFVMEYVKGGELFGKLANGRLDENVARKYFRQLISALDYCHSRGVYHRDLKPENLLVDEDDNLKVSDFGLSALAESRHQDGLFHTRCGTPAYVAPEVIQKRGYDGAKTDVWSCGVILYVLLAGFLPFRDSNIMEMYKKIQNGDFKCPSWFGKRVRKMLAKILDPNPQTRVTVEKIMQSRWFLKGIDAKAGKIMPLESDDLSDDSLPETRDEDGGLSITPSNMNAFDIISLSAGLDLSGMFEEKWGEKKELRFLSNRAANAIIGKLEEAAKRLKMKVTRKGGKVKMEGCKGGRKGLLGIDAEVYEITPEFHLVEVKKSSGDTMEYRQAMTGSVRPSLQEIVWTWEGEKPPPVEENIIVDQENN